MFDPSSSWMLWDQAVFIKLHATAASPPWLVATAVVLAQWALIIALVITGWQLLRHRDGTGAWRVLVAWMVSYGIELMIKNFAFYPRPFAAGFGPSILAHGASNSMPSTHVTVGLILVLALALGRHFRSSMAVLTLTVALAWARVYVGIHWPVDMLGALLSATLSMTVAISLQRVLVAARQRWPHGDLPASDAPLHLSTLSPNDQQTTDCSGDQRCDS